MIDLVRDCSLCIWSVFECNRCVGNGLIVIFYFWSQFTCTRVRGFVSI